MSNGKNTKNDIFANMKQKGQQLGTSEEQRKQNKADYERYDADPDYVDVYLDTVTYGLKARHHKHRRNPKGKKHFGLKPYELEESFQNVIVEIGGSCILLNEKMKRSNGETARGLDALVNGILTDIRSVTEPNTNIRNCITDKHKQLVGYKRDFDVDVSTMSLFFYDDSFYSNEKITKAINDYKQIAQNYPSGIVVKKIFVVLRNRKQIIEYSVV